MKKLALVLGAVATALTSATTFAATSGKVEINGEVYEETCRIYDPHVNQYLTLPSIGNTKLAARGEVSSEQVPFSIRLVDCPTNRAAGVLFEQTNVEQHNFGSLKNTLSGRGAAKNVNIQLMQGGQGMDLTNQDTSGYQIPTSADGALTYNYAARYIATDAAAPGLVKTLATFRVNYK